MKDLSQIFRDLFSLKLRKWEKGEGGGNGQTIKFILYNMIHSIASYNKYHIRCNQFLFNNILPSKFIVVNYIWHMFFLYYIYPDKYNKYRTKSSFLY